MSVSRVDCRFEYGDMLSGDLSPSKAPYEFLRLTAEHATAYHLDPSDGAGGIVKTGSVHGVYDDFLDFLRWERPNALGSSSVSR